MAIFNMLLGNISQIKVHNFLKITNSSLFSRREIASEKK